MVSANTGGPPPPFYGPMPRPMLSEEHMALADFAWRLGSSNCTSEGPGGIVDETRQDAELLMSLMLSSTSPALHSDDVIPDSEPLSSSEGSFSSDSSYSNSTRRDIFTFTCPSLSLETPGLHSSSLLQCSVDAPTAVFTASQNTLPPSNASPPPALLLGRPLKVDDRDALRLSADAMARNVLQSFQKAMDWRLQVWMEAVCKQLANQERAMLKAGADMEEIKTLLETPEAALIALLRKFADENEITVNSVNTSFQVLPQRVEQKKETEESQQRRESLDSTSTSTSSLGSHEDSQVHQNVTTITNAPPSNSMIESDYLYTVIYKLEFSCDVYVETPAGLTEITFKIPGTIKGKFASNEIDPAADLQSVTVDLDTGVLAHMVEKGCRTVVRTSVEKVMSQAEETEDPEEEEAEVDAPPAALTPSKDDSPSHKMYSPITCATPGATVVTPHSVSQGSEPSDGTDSAIKALFPIPDDFGSGQEHLPRRISPSLLPMKRGSPPPTTTTEEQHQGGGGGSTKRRLPLISPPGNNNSDFHEVNENGPSFPLLCEVAARARSLTD